MKYIIAIVCIVIFTSGCSINVNTQNDNNASDNTISENVISEAISETKETEENEETTTEIDYVETTKTAKIYCPSTEYYISGSVTANDSATPVKLTELSRIQNNIIDTEDWFKLNNLSYPVMGENEDYRYDVMFSIYDDLTSTYTSTLTIYDKQTGNERYTLDFSDFCYVGEQDTYMSDREIQWAACKDDILYVSIWQNGYAQPNSCYIVAVDLDTMEVLWKSDSLVSNANNFILFDDVIMCAYGFTAEPDYIYQIDINTGEIIDSYLLKTMADYLILKGDKLYVRCYDTDYVFQVDDSRANTGTSENADDEPVEYSFEDLANYSYEFSSGAGGWSTDFNIEKDGYFHGNYHDSDMGVTGDGYEGGTVYSAIFTGHFSGLKKVDEYAYEMTLSDISYKDEGVEEEIIDDVKYIYVDDAYGISGTQRYLVYFPGTPLDIFDEEISSWIHANYMDESVLQTPVIVNVDQNYGIYSYERLSASEDAKMNYDSYKLSYDYWLDKIDETSITVDMVENANHRYKVADDCLNYLWNLIKYNTDDATFQTILEEQRSWLKERDAQAEENRDSWESGTFAQVDYYDTLATMTMERCEELLGYLN